MFILAIAPIRLLRTFSQENILNILPCSFNRDVKSLLSYISSGGSRDREWITIMFVSSFASGIPFG